jgi:hypothetical protein
MDDHQFHTLTAENVVHRINGAGIVGKKVNQIQNNVIVDCYDTEGDGQAHVSVRHRGPSHGFGIRRNVIVQPEREDRIELIEFTDLIEQSLVDDNCYWSHAGDDIAAEVIGDLRDQGQGTRSIACDPGVETTDGEIVIPDDTAAREVGFRPFHEWGPREVPGPRT